MRKPSEILRHAASLLESDVEMCDCCCWSIVAAIEGVKSIGCIYLSHYAAHSSEYQEAMKYLHLMVPPNKVSELLRNGSVEGYWLDDFSLTEEKQRGRRSVALCLAAAIAESEGR